MKTFLQIGHRAVNVYQIVRIQFTPGTVCVDLAVLDGDGAAYIMFHDDEAEAFIEWWEQEADVYHAL